MRTPSLVAFLLAFALSAPGCGSREENEARLFLDRVATIDDSAPPARRRPQVEALAALPLETDAIRTARDTCVRAHEALLEAEEEQASARGRLSDVTTRAGGGAAVPDDERRAIESAIARSNAALGRARDLLPRCQSEVAALETRHAGRRDP